MQSSLKKKFLVAAVSLMSTGIISSPAHSAATVDSAIPEYTAASGISGNLSSVGSDTLANLMTLMGRGF